MRAVNASFGNGLSGKPPPKPVHLNAHRHQCGKGQILGDIWPLPHYFV
jgi:hypothetical protein